MLEKSVIQELLEYFYYHQYEHEDYYPCYDMLPDYDEYGNEYNCIYIVK